MNTKDPVGQGLGQGQAQATTLLPTPDPLSPPREGRGPAPLVGGRLGMLIRPGTAEANLRGILHGRGADKWDMGLGRALCAHSYPRSATGPEA